MFTVLFGVAQLILFIKLLDLIQGSDASSHNTSSYSATSSNAAASGAIFSHLGTHDRVNSARAAVAFRSSSDTKEPVKSLETRKSNNSSLTDVQNDGQDRSDSEGRGCPVGASSYLLSQSVVLRPFMLIWDQQLPVNLLRIG